MPVLVLEIELGDTGLNAADAIEAAVIDLAVIWNQCTRTDELPSTKRKIGLFTKNKRAVGFWVIKKES